MAALPADTCRTCQPLRLPTLLEGARDRHALSAKHASRTNNGYVASVSTATSTSSHCSPSLDSELSDQSEVEHSPPCVRTSTAMLTQSRHCEEENMNSSDFELAACFANMVGLPELKTDALKSISRSFRFLCSCGYHIEDICVVFAHASIYFLPIYERCGKMSNTEAANIILVLIYVAHSYVQDRNCPLRIWHEYFFRNYCTLHMLNQTLIGIMKLRGYVLRVDEDEIAERYTRLCACVQRTSQ